MRYYIICNIYQNEVEFHHKHNVNDIKSPPPPLFFPSTASDLLLLWFKLTSLNNVEKVSYFFALYPKHLLGLFFNLLCHSLIELVIMKTEIWVFKWGLLYNFWQKRFGITLPPNLWWISSFQIFNMLHHLILNKVLADIKL